jgi:hypothetical protein
MAISTIEIAILKEMRGIEAGVELWRYTTADLWFIADQVGAVVRKRKLSKEELINAVLAVTHPASSPAAPLATVEQVRMF